MKFPFSLKNGKDGSDNTSWYDDHLWQNYLNYYKLSIVQIFASIRKKYLIATGNSAV